MICNTWIPVLDGLGPRCTALEVDSFRRPEDSSFLGQGPPWLQTMIRCFYRRAAFQPTLKETNYPQLEFELEQATSSSITCPGLLGQKSRATLVLDFETQRGPRNALRSSQPLSQCLWFPYHVTSLLHTERPTDRHNDRETNRQTDGQTKRQVDGYRHICRHMRIRYDCTCGTTYTTIARTIACSKDRQWDRRDRKIDGHCYCRLLPTTTQGCLLRGLFAIYPVLPSLLLCRTFAWPSNTGEAALNPKPSSLNSKTLKIRSRSLKP